MMQGCICAVHNLSALVHLPSTNLTNLCVRTSGHGVRTDYFHRCIACFPFLRSLIAEGGKAWHVIVNDHMRLTLAHTPEVHCACNSEAELCPHAIDLDCDPCMTCMVHQTKQSRVAHVVDCTQGSKTTRCSMLQQNRVRQCPGVLAHGFLAWQAIEHRQARKCCSGRTASVLHFDVNTAKAGRFFRIE